MYNPKQFTQNDLASQIKLIENAPFATLVSPTDNSYMISHIPLIIGGRNPLRLHGHFAKANPHHLHFDQKSVTCIFHGPHAYISPDWYIDQGVPTWNYMTVHCHGKAQIIDNSDWTLNLLDQLTVNLESKLDKTPWLMDSDSPVVLKQLKGIVGFEITVDKVDAKFKLSQNRSRADQMGVIDALKRTKNSSSQEMASFMESRLST